jgi:hypothetical protein
MTRKKTKCIETEIKTVKKFSLFFRPICLVLVGPEHFHNPSLPHYFFANRAVPRSRLKTNKKGTNKNNIHQSLFTSIVFRSHLPGSNFGHTARSAFLLAFGQSSRIFNKPLIFLRFFVLHPCCLTRQAQTRPSRPSHAAIQSKCPPDQNDTTQGFCCLLQRMK